MLTRLRLLRSSTQLLPSGNPPLCRQFSQEKLPTPEELFPTNRWGRLDIRPPKEFYSHGKKFWTNLPPLTFKTFYSPETLPEADSERPEIVFVGRSNVGKSSLLNALIQRNDLFRTSSVPGKTQSINFFSVREQLYIVDCPGYGYAQYSKKKRTQWQSMIREYLTERTSISRICILIDSRVGIKESDDELMKFLDKNSTASFQIVLTKLDQINEGHKKKLMPELFKKVDKYRQCFPDVIETSAKKGIGIDHLRASLFQMCSGRLLPEPVVVSE